MIKGLEHLSDEKKFKSLELYDTWVVKVLSPSLIISELRSTQVSG